MSPQPKSSGRFEAASRKFAISALMQNRVCSYFRTDSHRNNKEILEAVVFGSDYIDLPQPMTLDLDTLPRLPALVSQQNHSCDK
jgi:hypothetical protein